MTQQELIQEYKDGKSISQLSRETEYTYCGIQKILRENNVAIRGGRKKKTLSPDQIVELRRLVEEEGKFLQELEDIFGFDKTTMKRICIENNIKRPNLNRVNMRLKENYFSVIDSPDKAYWLGFLFTDGSVD